MLEAMDSGHAQDPLLDQVVADRYHVRMQLGVGAMGSVYLAEHTMMGNAVALKVLHPDQSKSNESVARFQREAQTASTINHPNICAATDFGRLDNGAFFMVMEYLEGLTLRQVIRKNAPLSPTRAIHITRQLASALGAAHQKGVIHRDIKPANVMLVERAGDRDFVKLTDFGLAGLSESHGDADEQVRLTIAGVVYGTPAYISPEQASAESAIDGRADLYGLGCILFEMLTGRLPFMGGNVTQMLTAHLTQEPPKASEFNLTHYIPPELDAIIVKLMAKRAEDRFARAEDLILALDALDLDETPEVTRITNQTQPPPIDRDASVNSPHEEQLATTPVHKEPSLGEKLATLPLPAKIALGAIPVLLLLILILIGVGVASYSEKVEPPPVPTDPEDLADYQVEQTTAKLAKERDKFVRRTDAMRPVLEHMASGEHTEALAKLGKLGEKPRKSPHYHYYLGIAYSAEDKDVESLDAYAEAITLEPRYAMDKRLIESALDALSSKDDEVEARAKKLLTGPLLETTSIPLARMAYDPGSNRGRKRARALLEETGKFDTLPPWRQDAIKLRLDVGCKPRGEAVERLGDAETPRALGPLREYARKPKRGCGRRDREDCYGCIRDEISEAIDKLEARFPDAIEADMSADMDPDMMEPREDSD